MSVSRADDLRVVRKQKIILANNNRSPIIVNNIMIIVEVPVGTRK